MAETQTDIAPKSKWLRRLLFAWLALLVIFLLVVIIARLTLRSDWGLNQVERRIEAMVPAGQKIEIENLQGDLLSEFTIDRLEISDNEKTWLTGDQVKLNWSPLRLLRNHLDISELSAAQINVIDRPIIVRANDSGSSYKIKSYDLAAFDFPSLSISDKFAPELLTLRANGSARHEGSQGQLILDARSLEEDPRDIVNANLSWSGNDLLKGDANITAEPGGLIASLLRLETEDTLEFTVQTRGELENLSTEIVGQLGQQEFITAAIERQDNSADISAQIRPALVPTLSQIDGLSAGTVDVQSQLTNISDNPVLTAEIGSPKIDINLVGTRDKTGYDFSNLKIDIRDPLAAFTESPATIAQASFDGTGRYSSSGVVLTGRIQSDGISYGEYDLASLSGPLDFSFQEYRLNLNTDLSGQVEENSSIARWTGRAPKAKINAMYDHNTQRVSLSDTRITLPGFRANGSGSINLDTKLADLTGQFTLDKNRLLPSLPASLSGNFKTSTQQGRMALTVTGTARDLGALPAPLPQLVEDQIAFNTTATLDQNRNIILRQFSAKADQLNVSGNGRYNSNKTLAADFSIDTGPFDLSNLSIASTQGTAKIDGSTTRMNIDLNGTAPKLSIGERQLTDIKLSADGTYNDRSIQADVTGSAQSENRPINLATKASYDNGRWALAGMDANFSGLSVTGDLSGQGGDIKAMIGDLALKGNPALFMPANQIDMSVKLAQASADIEGMIDGINVGVLSDAKLEINAQGPRNALTFSTKLTGDAIIQEITRPIDLAAQGQADLSFPLASVTTDLTGELGRFPITTTTPLTLSQSEFGFNGNGALSIFGGQVEFSKSTAKNSWIIGGSDMATSDLLSMAGRSPLEGQLDFDGRFTPVADRLDADITAKLQDVKQPGSDSPPFAADIIASITNNQLQLEATSQGEDLEGRATLAGFVETLSRSPFVDWPPENTLTGKAEASGKIGSIAELFLPPETEVKGGVNLNLNYSYPLDARGLNGTMAMREGEFENGTIGLKLKDIIFDANFTGTQVTVSRFDAKGSKGGELTGGGTMDVGFNNGSAVTLAAKKLRVFNRREGFAIVSGDIKLSHEDDKLTLGGNLVAEDAELSIDKFPRAGRPTLDVSFNQDEEEDDIKRSQTATALNLSLSSPGRIQLRGRGVNADMALDAKITGPFDEPILSGEASITRGRFDFIGKRFMFQDSEVIFNDDVMQSTLDIEAERETADLTATVKITGTIEKPKIELTAEPSLPEDEVLSRILFGRSPSQLTTIETARLAAALAQLSGGGGFDLLGNLESALGLDTLDFNQNGDGQAQITTGKYLSDDVYVEVRSSAEGTPGVAIEWTPRKNIAVEAETAPGERQRVSVQWQKDFD